MSIRHAVFATALLLFSSAIGVAGPVFYTISYGDAPIFGTIDPFTGTVTQIGTPLAGYGHDVTVSPTGSVYAVIDQDLYSINKFTAAATHIGTFAAEMQTLAFRGDGTLFGAAFDGFLYTVNPLTGVETAVGSMGLPDGPDNIRFDDLGNLYIMTATTNSALYLLNQSTGAGSFVGLSGQDDTSLGAFYGGVFLASNAPGGAPQMLTVDRSTGLGTPGASANGIYLFALDPTSVPEPGTVAMVVGGLGVLLLARRRVFVG
jgi:hypothetical protein